MLNVAEYLIGLMTIGEIEATDFIHYSEDVDDKDYCEDFYIRVGDFLDNKEDLYTQEGGFDLRINRFATFHEIRGGKEYIRKVVEVVYFLGD